MRLRPLGERPTAPPAARLPPFAAGFSRAPGSFAEAGAIPYAARRVQAPVHRMEAPPWQAPWHTMCNESSIVSQESFGARRCGRFTQNALGSDRRGLRVERRAPGQAVQQAHVGK